MADLKIYGAGQAIRKLREQSGVGLNELTTRLPGWSRGTLSKYERNDLALSLSVIQAIAQALNRPVEFVILECLKTVYPALLNSDVGRVLQRIVNEFDRMPDK